MRAPAHGWLILASWLVASRAHAQDCAQRRQKDTVVMPARNAENVARDIAVEVRYPPGTDLAELGRGQSGGRPLVSLRDEAGDLLAGDVEQVDALTVRFAPAARLDPGARYVSEVVRPGFDRPEITDYLFTTGDSVDREAPQLGADETTIDVLVERLPERCGAPAGTHGVRVALAGATDDTDARAIEYFLFMTRGEGVGAPLLVDRTRELDEGRVRLAFRLPEAGVAQPMCVAIRAVDGVGKAALNEPEVCFHPEQGPYFESGCGVARGPAPGGANAGQAFLLFYGLMLLRARRRRS